MRGAAGGSVRAFGRRLVGAVAALAAGVALVACAPGIETPGKQDAIRLVSTATVDGWRFDYYVNEAYPCSISGYQTFTIGTRVGSPAGAEAPLWVRMRGGGVGFFAPDGTPMPDAGNKRQENAVGMRTRLLTDDIMGLVRSDVAGFRLLSVSMCNHDIYAGGDVEDPNNPNLLPSGARRTVNGLFATKAAVEFTSGAYPTSDTFLHGTSAGGFGTFHVAWALEEQGLAPAGLVADSGVLNRDWQLAQADQGLCTTPAEAAGLLEVEKRLHPAVADPANQPHLLVADGRLTVPVLQVWSVGDPGQCGQRPMQCPLPGGAVVTMGSVDCLHEPLRQAIAAAGPSPGSPLSSSLSMRLCVDGPGAAACDLHTPTNSPGAVNTDPAWPADFNPVILDWVHQRMGG